MTPKEKADDLVRKMQSQRHMPLGASIQCAIVCVDEILNELDKISSDDGYFEAKFDFYSDVKIELKNI